jgi:hypothetical protein
MGVVVSLKRNDPFFSRFQLIAQERILFPQSCVFLGEIIIQSFALLLIILVNLNCCLQLLNLHDLQFHLVLQLSFGPIIAVFALLILAQKFSDVDFLILKGKFEVSSHCFELFLQEFMLFLKLVVFIFRNL